jgi:SPP1 gp7 family putative phage head morphogenesis protein
VRRAARKQAEITRSKTRTKANTQAKSLQGVQPFGQEPWLNDFIDLFVESNVGLIKKLHDDQIARVSKIVRDGALSGQTQATMSKQLDEVLGVGNRHARLIARDQTAKLNSQLTEVRMRRIGVESYEWSTSHDERVRPEHAARDGKIFRWDSPPPDGHPGEAINCRCVAIPVMDAEDEG